MNLKILMVAAAAYLWWKHSKAQPAATAGTPAYVDSLNTTIGVSKVLPGPVADYHVTTNPATPAPVAFTSDTGTPPWSHDSTMRGMGLVPLYAGSGSYVPPSEAAGYEAALAVHNANAAALDASGLFSVG